MYKVFRAFAVCDLVCNPDDVGYEVTSRSPPVLFDPVRVVVMLRDTDLVPSFRMTWITEDVDDSFPIFWGEVLT
jgi:hypothetical protein